MLWSGLREGRGRGFGGYPRGSWMVLRDLLLGTGEAPTEVLLKRMRVEFVGNDDDHIRGEGALRALVVNV